MGFVEAPQDEDYSTFKKHPDCVQWSPDKRYLYYSLLGRLGNWMMSYALLYSAAKTYGYDVFMPKRHLEQLCLLFEDEESQKLESGIVKPIEDTCFEEYPWKSTMRSIYSYNTTENYSFEIFRKLRVMGNTVNQIMRWSEMLEKHTDDIRKEVFKFNRKYSEMAEKKIQRVKKLHLERARKKKRKLQGDIVFVGIHIRKSDSEINMVEAYNMPKLDHLYYLEAMDMYKAKYKNVAFVIVTDNPSWVKKHLLPETKSFSVHYKESNNPGFDMATMAATNHTILSYGTFSFWCGFLAGGKRIIPYSLMGTHDSKIRRNPLDLLELSPFHFPDEGLVYFSDEELAQYKAMGAGLPTNFDELRRALRLSTKYNS